LASNKIEKWFEIEIRKIFKKNKNINNPFLDFPHLKIVIFLRVPAAICHQTTNQLIRLQQPAAADLPAPKHSCSLQEAF